MAAPKYVPPPVQQTKYYQSTAKIRHSSGVERPAEIYIHNANEAGTGHPGPDQGYALRLVKDFKDKIFLFPGEHWQDASEVAVSKMIAKALGDENAPPSLEELLVLMILKLVFGFGVILTQTQKTN